MKKSPIYESGRYTINMDLVTMTRWTDHLSPELMIYFTQSPHIGLDTEPGKQFLKAYRMYHSPSK